MIEFLLGVDVRFNLDEVVTEFKIRRLKFSLELNQVLLTIFKGQANCVQLTEGINLCKNLADPYV